MGHAHILTGQLADQDVAVKTFKPLLLILRLVHFHAGKQPLAAG